jgi:biotin synthase-like enzyme
MGELTQEQINQAIQLVKEHPDRIGVNLFKRYMNHVGIITANKLLEELENRRIISKWNNVRTLLV